MSAIRLLDLNGLVTQIEQYNNNVYELMVGRIETESKKTKINTLAEVVICINTAAISPDTDVDELVERTNALIEEYRRVISRMQPGGPGNEKGGRKKKNVEEPEVK